MPLGGLLKNLVHGESGGLPPEKSEAAMVAESLMMELDFHIKEAEQLEQEREQEHQRQVTGVDYSWLVTPNTKVKFEMSQVERLELEELCTKVKPLECGKVITMFRDTLFRQPPAYEIPRLLRCVINQTLETRASAEATTMPDWITRSLSRLRPTSSKVTPVGGEMELQGRESSSTVGSFNNSTTTTDIEDPLENNQELFTRVAHLPV